MKKRVKSKVDIRKSEFDFIGFVEFDISARAAYKI